MPTVDQVKHSLSTGGKVEDTRCDKAKHVRDARPTLIDHNEAEWVSTMNFLHQKQKAEEDRKQDSEQTFECGNWNVMHEKARDDDGEAITDCVQVSVLSIIV
jgi:hypothetical protein